MQRKVSLSRALPADTVISVVDIGASDVDGPPPYMPLVEAGRAAILGFEPNPAEFAKLDARRASHETYLPYALGDGREHTIHYCAAPGMTSLFEPNSELLAYFYGFPEWGRVTHTERIQTVRLDDVPEIEHMDYLKIDIQGAELMVFENAVTRLADCLVVHAETLFLPMYVGQPLFSEVEQFLRRQGFMIHTFAPLISRVVRPLLVNNNPHSPLRQIFWADAVFVRDFTRFDKLGDVELLKFAAILNDCYGSFDLALRALMELDRRQHSERARGYLSALTDLTGNMEKRG